jgi:hypothetical protein
LAVAGNDIAQQSSVNGQATTGTNELFHLKHLFGFDCVGPVVEKKPETSSKSIKLPRIKALWVVPV